MVQEVAYNNSWYTLKGRIGKAEVTSYSYSAFGELLQNESSGFRFNGEQYESANGRIIKSFNLEGTAVFEWDEDFLNGSHYHILGPVGNSRIPDAFGEKHLFPWVPI